MSSLSVLGKAGETQRLCQVRLRDFRNYATLDLPIDGGFHVLAGPNAQGKTNLLEAVYLLASTRLLRGMRDFEAIREGASKALVEADLAGHSTTVALTLEKGVRKRASLNGVSLPRAADLIGRLVVVCVSSADLPIVSGEPSDRRLFLDIELSQLYPGYLRALTHYKRALEQRNSLLKAAQETNVSAEAFEVWEIQMAEHGAALRHYRRAFTQEIANYASSTHALLGLGETLQVTYAPKDDAEDADALFCLYGNGRQTEIARGSSNSGPHRDDLAINIDGREGRLYGSQGQQRSAVVAMKLATLEHMRDVLGETPLLLLDDILSDLDAGRRERLCGWVLERANQAILTCTESAAAGKAILSKATLIHVLNGTIEVA